MRTTKNTPPPRPQDLSQDEIGFERQQMVRWLSPTGLWRTSVKAALSTVIGQYADRREIEAAMPAQYDDQFDYSSGPETWFDYLADTGDGFDSTMSMALLAGQPSIDVQGKGPMERSRLIILGGDQVYPTASMSSYEQRMVGPFRCALPWSHDEPSAPDLYALPGNHDWYDGLTSFLRVFAQKKWIGGWLTKQQRSYFAVKLRPNWWLWAIDNQFDAYIDDPQLNYFSDAASHLRENDGIVLCTSRPTWVESNNPEAIEAYGPTDYFVRTIIAPTGANVRLWLSGDSHHYARYTVKSDGTQLITCGGAGAFMSATHHLPEQLEVPPAASLDHGKSKPARECHLQTCYPNKKTSRSFTRAAWKVPYMNGGFPVFVAAIYLLLSQPLLSNGARVSGIGNAFDRALSSSAIWVSTLILATLLGIFTKRHKMLVRWALGTTHAAAHIATMSICAGLTGVVLGTAGGFWREFGELAMMVGLGVVGGCGIFSAYLFIADRVFATNTNELFSAMHRDGHNCFLRIHATDDELTVHSIGLDEANRTWITDPGGQAEDPWITPVEPLKPHLIEKPIVIQRVPGHAKVVDLEEPVVDARDDAALAATDDTATDHTTGAPS